MAVAHDAASESHTGTTGSQSEASFSWTHTPTGTPRGVLVFVVSYGTAVDGVSSVTYGGTSMTAVSGGRAADTAGEPGSCKAYFLGSSVPTGAQSVVVNRVNDTTVMYAVAITVTAANDTATTGVVLLQEDGTLAEQSVDDGLPGVNSVRYAGLHSGLAAVPSAGASSTALHSIDFFNNVAAVVRETTAGQGARSVGFSDGTSDDRAAVHLAVKEIGGATFTATAAVAIGQVAVSGVGTHPFTATAAVAIGQVAVSGSGVQTHSATSAVAIGQVAFSGTGVLAQHSATAAISIGQVAFAGAGVQTHSATGLIAIGQVAVSGSGVQTHSATGLIAIGQIAFSGTGTHSGVTGTAAVALGQVTFSATGVQTTVAVAIGIIASALAGERGAVALSYRFEKRTHTNLFIADLTPAFLVEASSIDVDNDRAIIRTARFRIDPAAAAIDPVVDHVAVLADLFVQGQTVTFPLGMFHLEAPVKTFDPNGRQLWDVEASDLGTHLISVTTQTPYTVTAGTNYMTAARTILTNLSLSHALPDVTSTLPVDMTWGPGTTWKAVLDDLMLGINYYPVWPDATGVFVTRPRINPASENSAVTYRTDAEPRMILPSFAEEQDTTRYPNKWVVLIDDPRRTPAFALRENADASSPISTANKAALLVETNGQNGAKAILDAATAGGFAEYQLRDAASRSRRAALRTLPDPRRTAREAYTLVVDTVQVNTLWIVRGWRLPLKSGAEMEHRLTRAESVVIT